MRNKNYHASNLTKMFWVEKADIAWLFSYTKIINYPTKFSQTFYSHFKQKVNTVKLRLKVLK